MNTSHSSLGVEGEEEEGLLECIIQRERDAKISSVY